MGPHPRMYFELLRPKKRRLLEPLQLLLEQWHPSQTRYPIQTGRTEGFFWNHAKERFAGRHGQNDVSPRLDLTKR
jgi:hypothetical protein